MICIGSILGRCCYNSTWDYSSSFIFRNLTKLFHWYLQAEACSDHQLPVLSWHCSISTHATDTGSLLSQMQRLRYSQDQWRHSCMSTMQNLLWENWAKPRFFCPELKKTRFTITHFHRGKARLKNFCSAEEELLLDILVPNLDQTKGNMFSYSKDM